MKRATPIFVLALLLGAQPHALGDGRPPLADAIAASIAAHPTEPSEPDSPTAGAAALYPTGFIVVPSTMYSFDSARNIIICGVTVGELFPGGGGCLKKAANTKGAAAIPGDYISAEAFIAKAVSPHAQYLGFTVEPSRNIVLFYRNIGRSVGDVSP